MSHEGFGRGDGRERHAAEAVEINVLTREEQVSTLGKHRYLRLGYAFAIVMQAVEGAVGRVVVVANGEGRGREGVFYLVVEARVEPVHVFSDALQMGLLPFFVGLRAVTRAAVGPLLHYMEGHDGRHYHLAGPWSLLRFGRCHVHKAPRPRVGGVFVVVPYMAVVLLKVAGMVDVGKGLGLENKVGAERGVAVGRLGDTLSEGF